MKKARNIAASHRAKLLVLAQHRGDNFQFLLGRWTIERFLYRLSQSRYQKEFVLKGASSLRGAASFTAQRGLSTSSGSAARSSTMLQHVFARSAQCRPMTAGSLHTTCAG